MKTGAVQKRQALTAKDGEEATPRVHGIVYNPRNGSFSSIQTDLKAEMKKLNSIYELFD
jgi:hypothetical protein